MRRILSYLFILMLFFSLAEAAPNISSFDGTPIDGTEVALSGTNFGQHALQIEWLGGFIEKGVQGSPFSKEHWFADTDSDGFNAPRYTDIKAHSGTKSILSKIEGSKWGSGFNYDNGSAIDKIYVSWWVYFDKGAESGQWKKWRLSPTTGYTDTSAEIYQPDFYNPDGSILQTMLTLFTSTNWGAWPPGQSYWLGGSQAVPVKRWVRLELYFKESDLDTFNGSFTYHIHNQSIPVQTIREYINNFMTVSTSATYKTRRYVQFQNYWGNSDRTKNTSIYMDDIYIQKGSPARVEIGDSSVWSDCKHREIQIPTIWSNDKIAFTFNKGSFQIGDAVYAYIIDETGNVSNKFGPIIIRNSSISPPNGFTATPN